MTCHYKNYTLLVCQKILLIGLSLISPTDLFWLISQIIFLNLHLYPVVYPKVLFRDHSYFYYMSVTCRKLSNVISFFMLMIRSYVIYQHKDINEIAKQLNVDFPNICDWFVDNKLIIHFGEDKIKSIVFASKFQKKNVKTYHKIRGYTNQTIFKVKYLGCLMDVKMSGEAMAFNVVHKINNKLKFLYPKNVF